VWDSGSSIFSIRRSSGSNILRSQQLDFLRHRHAAERLRVLSFDFRRRESRRQFRATDRVPGTLRNQFTTPSIYVFDTRVAKSIKFGEKYSLSLLAEAFNLFNRSNIATVNTGRYGIASSSATALTNPALSTPFGSARTLLGERQIHLGARFKF